MQTPEEYKEKCRQEFADFIWKMDYEGGFVGLLYHSGLQYFPRQLVPTAKEFQRALHQLESDIETYGEAIGFHSTDDALRYAEEQWA